MFKGKSSFKVTAVLLLYFLHRIETIANKFGTIRLELSSTLLETFNFRLKSKEGLKLTLLIGLGFKEISF